MKRFFKWLAIVIGVLVVLIVLTLLIVPRFYDIQKLKPRIEQSVQEVTGRPFVLGGKLELSLFPWAGIALTDVSLGNPKGFEAEQFATFSEFEVRMKLLPLLSRNIQVERLVLKDLRLILERKQDGQVNWEFAKTSEKKEEKAPAKGTADTDDTFSIRDLSVGEISVANGSILYLDRQTDVRKELSDVTIQLADISLNEPVDIRFSGRLDNKPFSLTGLVGPLGSPLGTGQVKVDLTAEAFAIAELHLSGQVVDPSSALSYEMDVAVAPFSPKRLIKEFKPDLDMVLSDPTVLEKVSLQATVSGNADQVSLTDGNLVMDDTTTTIQVHVKDVSKPNIDWNVHMDAIDIDRYLPKAELETTETAAGAEQAIGTGQVDKDRIDYAPLRNMVVSGTISIDQLKAGGGTVQDVVMKVTGASGKFRIDPISMNLYQGSATVTGAVDVTGNVPKTSLNIRADGIQAEPLLKDFIGKDFLTGTTLAQISLVTTGDAPAQIKKSLTGKGSILFKEGAIRGVDIVGMVHNIKTAFGLAEPTQRPETEFSEFKNPFTIEGGIYETTTTALTSPVLHVEANGKADLVQETLDFQIKPTWIDPTKKTTDGQKITGSLVPILVTGTFSDPKFRPDVEDAAKKAVTKALSDLFGSESDETEKADTDKSDALDGTEDTVEEFLKQLDFGQ